MNAPACDDRLALGLVGLGLLEHPAVHALGALAERVLRLWSGPAENPSSETPLSHVTFVMVAPSDRGAVPLRRSHACNLDITHHVGMSTSLELRHLRAFVAVAEELHFTRAAARLHLAQQALSTQIRQLEDELGTPLFHRTTRRVELTDAGRTLLLHAGPILASVSAAVEQTHRAGSGELGTLSIAYTPTVAEETLPPLIAAVHDRLPDVRVRTCEMWQAEMAEAVEAGRFDIGLARCPILHDDLESAVIRDEPLGITLADSHRARPQPARANRGPRCREAAHLAAGAVARLPRPRRRLAARARVPRARPGVREPQPRRPARRRALARRGRRRPRLLDRLRVAGAVAPGRLRVAAARSRAADPRRHVLAPRGIAGRAHVRASRARGGRVARAGSRAR